MKNCPRCHRSLSLEAFGTRMRNNKRIPLSWCRECKRKYDREKKQIELLDSAKRAEVNVNKKLAYSSGRETVRVYLSTHPCVDCGESDVSVLEFDHDDANQKHQNVSMLLNSPRALQKEIEKCTVRCGNCHRHKTMHEQNTWRAKYCKQLNCRWA